MAIEHFVIAGAQRSGTTWLYRLLEMHPQIALARPLRPEPKFFLGSDSLRRQDYDRLFPPPDPGLRLRGEKSTSYMERPEVPARIRELLPEARIVFLLRDPVERAISNYWFSVQSGLERAPVDEALEREMAGEPPPPAEGPDGRPVSVSPFAYLGRGDYEAQIARFGEHFPRTQLLPVVFERLRQEPDRELPRLLAALGADPQLQPRVPREAVNASPRQGAESRALRHRLAAWFAEPNRRLGERWGLDLSCWSVAGAAA